MRMLHSHEFFYFSTWSIGFSLVSSKYLSCFVCLVFLWLNWIIEFPLIYLLTLFNVDYKTLAAYALIKIDYPLSPSHKKHNKNINKNVKEENRMRIHLERKLVSQG